MREVLATYLLAQLPGWVAAGLVLWGLHDWGGFPAAFAAGLLFAWMAKDLLLFPVMRRFYEPAPAGGRMVGETGAAVTALAPDGLVRVRGELWKARSDRDIPAGARVAVRDVDGLTLLVTPVSPDPQM